MLKHCVFLSLQREANPLQVEAAMALLRGLQSKIDGMVEFNCGPNLDYEARSAAYQYGFVITFTNRIAHLAYETHPDHQLAGAMIVAMCQDGIEGIFVADLAVLDTTN